MKNSPTLDLTIVLAATVLCSWGCAGEGPGPKASEEKAQGPRIEAVGIGGEALVVETEPVIEKEGVKKQPWWDVPIYLLIPEKSEAKYKAWWEDVTRKSRIGGMVRDHEISKELLSGRPMVFRVGLQNRKSDGQLAYLIVLIHTKEKPVVSEMRGKITLLANPGP